MEVSDVEPLASIDPQRRGNDAPVEAKNGLQNTNGEKDFRRCNENYQDFPEIGRDETTYPRKK